MDLFDLSAKITLNTKGYKDAIKDAENETSGFGSKIGKAFGTLGKVTLAGLGAAAAGVGTLVKSAVSSYADYEQLVGGVETLFKDSADIVQEYASNAYKTAGMSANQYMETVTSFSASLLQSLGGDTEKAAKYGDMAVQDMADNANKMGTAIESIQLAYQGFARGQYGLLDNLKLGYGGTKEEMERLLEDAEKISGIHYDISSLSDVYDAIHVVQTEMGITGTTAKEAASTISGSTAMMKSSWQNLVTGIADDTADFELLIDNFVESVGTMANNILPRISKALSGVGKLITGLAPTIAAAVPALVGDILPTLTTSAMQLLMSFGQAIITNLPMLADSALQVILSLADGIANSLPELIPTIVDVVLQIVDTLIDNVDKLVEASLQIIIALASGLIQSLPRLLAKAPEIILSLVQAIIGAVGQLAQAAGSIISTLAQGIGARISTIIGKGKEVLVAFKNGVVSAVGSLASAGLNLVQGIWNGISNGLGWIKGKIQGWVGNVTSFIKGLFGIHSPSTVMRDQVGKFLALGIGEGFTREMTNVEKMMQNSMPDLTSNIDVNGNYNGYGYGSGSLGGMAINGDVYITVEGAGKNAEEIGRDLYKQLIRRGGVAYAY